MNRYKPTLPAVLVTVKYERMPRRAQARQANGALRSRQTTGDLSKVGQHFSAHLRPRFRIRRAEHGRGMVRGKYK